MRTILRVIDFETTGLPSEGEQSVVEYAFVDIDLEKKEIIHQERDFVKPTTEMEIQARATHHIKDIDLIGAMSWGAAYNKIVNSNTSEVIFVAHNADFEKEFFNPPLALWIDTYKCALRLYPDAPAYGNQVLKYYLNIKDTESFYPPHRALPDTELTAQILLRMLSISSLEALLKISREPMFLTKLTFGKYYGKKYSEVPKSYLKWIVGNTNMEEGVIAAAKRALGNG